MTTRTDIIINPADKGGAIVVMDIADYTEEVYCQLSEQKFYECNPGDPSGEHARVVTMEETVGSTKNKPH